MNRFLLLLLLSGLLGTPGLPALGQPDVGSPVAPVPVSVEDSLKLVALSAKKAPAAPPAARAAAPGVGADTVPSGAVRVIAPAASPLESSWWGLAVAGVVGLVVGALAMRWWTQYMVRDMKAGYEERKRKNREETREYKAIAARLQVENSDLELKLLKLSPKPPGDQPQPAGDAPASPSS